ncbi:6-phosphogluconolactonase [Fictibacillus norfolkensis]|uniref:6-phosphogluconolactonase n=1 Tax=Fictibacillus norfolkensis TaxID=2762233 RepID=A0ABR8SN49_9BACL|nr:6-phosphogluconolactonase [Fictibacillus norfolkensis]MBD7964886.1 6-phosphogluconolactonase [Fictibacillus norfolkensis]
MIKIFEDEQAVTNQVAKEMMQHLLNDENPVFCLASGTTPKKSYLQFVGEAKNNPRLKDLRIVSLDEWVGIDRTSEGSCYQMLNKDLFSPLELRDSQIEFFDGTAPDFQNECHRIDRFIENNPITFSLMGVGMNGHIGLNEPGCSVLDHSCVVDLSEKTKIVAQKYFNQPTSLKKGITLGLGQIMKSKRVIVVMTGERKAEIAKEIIMNREAQLPAQVLLGYDHIDFYLDREAAKWIDEASLKKENDLHE